MNVSEQGLVSVIIPTYGRPTLLKRSIESVIEQTHNKFEIIVIDDNNPNSGERKETEIIMRDYINKKNILYIKHDKNKNGAAARNTGIENSSGQFICFLDDDDWFLPNKLKVQIEYLVNNTDFHAVYCGWIKNGVEFLPTHSGSLTKELLMMDYQPMTPTLMFRRETILSLNGFDESFKRHQDYELMLRFFKKFRVSYVNECLVQIGWNDGENNLHGENLETLKKNFLKQFKSEIDSLDSNYPGISKKIYARHYSRVFVNHINHGYYKLAFQLISKCLRFIPINFIFEVNRTLIIYIKNKRQNHI
ncbi:glycosyltransferase family 2 protein [Marinilactibacillus psychrotolerans]|uniref:glycosyltransferase family 2 protein n=1 Tax=Marinilactibacillus psychrotolerans TaxID=191770 RepID=UPI0038838EC3